VAVGIGLCAAAAAAASALALTHGAAHGQSTALAVTTIVAGSMFVAAGIVAWLRRPANLTGPLMIAAGFLLFGGSLAQANQSLPFTIGLVVGPIPAAIIAQLMLAFPDGRLHSRWERLAVGAAYFDVIVLQIAMLMFMGFENLSGCPCPDNLLLIRDDMTVHSALMGSQRVVSTIVAVWIGVLLARRWQMASRPLRRAIAPVLFASAVTVALVVSSLLVTNDTAAQALHVASQIGLATVPVAYLMGLFAARMARVSVGDLVVELSRQPAPGQLRVALAHALRDPHWNWPTGSRNRARTWVSRVSRWTFGPPREGRSPSSRSEIGEWPLCSTTQLSGRTPSYSRPSAVRLGSRWRTNDYRLSYVRS
jgi:predicted transporter